MGVRRLSAVLAIGVVLGACTVTASDGGRQGPDRSPGGTLRLGMSVPAYYALDPQVEYSFSSWELFRCCLLRTLMSYDGTSGVDGVEPKPDLAVAPPEVSPDGLVWTFHIRPGLNYALPLENVPIAAPDIVRALLRAGDPNASNPNLAGQYFTNIEGYADYAAGTSDSVSGLETPDDLTLRISEVRPDSTLPYQLTLPDSAPIPPLPSDPEAKLGVATGHDRDLNPAHENGYGRVLVSSGPYMIEGAGSIDFSEPPDRQQPAPGFVPWRFTSGYATKAYGSITLVRNPSWHPATDPLRPANADRIVIVGGDRLDLYRRFAAGDLDMVFDLGPPPQMLRRYLNDDALRSDVRTLDTNDLVAADFDVARPPFDDLNVRRAVAYALDRRSMLERIAPAFGFSSVHVADHYANDASEQSLAAGWSPFPSTDGNPDMTAAREAMNRSRYGRGGRCVDPACRHVVIELDPGLAAVRDDIERALALLGIRVTVRVPMDLYETCYRASVPWGICVGDAWIPDFPSTGNGLIWYFAGPSIRLSPTLTHVGMSPARLRELGLPVTSVPTVDPDIRACQEEVGDAAVACWTRLDQYIVTQLMPAVPLAFGQGVRLTSPSTEGFSWDQGFQAPALDRLEVVASS